MPADPPPVESTTPTAGSPQEPTPEGGQTTNAKPVLLRPTDPFVDAIHFADAEGEGKPVTVLAAGTAVSKKTAKTIEDVAKRDGLRVTTVEEG